MDRKQFLIIAFATFITVTAWVVFDIIHTRANVNIPTDIQDAIEPLNPDFDTGALQNK